MKATIISNMEELDSVKTKAVILSFRPSLEDIIVLKEKRIKDIQISPGSAKTLNIHARKLMDMFHMHLRVGCIKGTRKDCHGSIVYIE